MADDEVIEDDNELEEPDDLDDAPEDLDEDLDPDVGVDDDLEDDRLVEGEDEEEKDDEEDEAAPVVPKAKKDDDEEEDDEEELDPDDVEADLDAILKDRIAAATEEDDEDEEDQPPEPDERTDGSGRILPKRPGEFVCQSCFLVKHPSQLAEPDLLLCNDCV